jgi:quercetin dioxygenase-like cupin family protein
MTSAGTGQHEPRAGDAIWNPLTGEKALFVESAEETGGARIVADFAVEAGGFVPGGEHVHDHCAEHIELQAGRVAFLIDGAMRALIAGERLTIAPGTWHRWWNASDGEVFAALARRRGLERTIDRYLDLETHPAAQAGLGRLPERVMTRTPHRG